MIKQLGTKLYYCNLTGNVIKIIGDCIGYVKETTFEEDYKIYAELNERDIKTIDVLKYEYGIYPKLSEGSTGVVVNLETKELIFSYDELPVPPVEPDRVDVLEDKISILEEENEALKVELSITQDAVNELLFNTLNA